MAEEKRKTLEEAQEDYQKIFDKIEELREKLAVADNKEKQELKESIAQLEDVLEMAGEKIATAAKAEEVQSEEVVSKAELPDFEEILKMSDDSKKEIVSSVNKYGLNQRKIADIVISIDDDDYKKEILSNAKQYGFSDYAILDITNSIKDKEFKQSAYDTSVLTYDPTSKAFAGSSLDLEFTENDTIESVAERLDSFVAEGSITREEADEIFERVGEELHLAAREELAALQKENSSYEKDKEANIELKEQLLKEDGAKSESVRGYDEAVKQIEAKITDNNKRIESLEKEVKNAPKVFDAASLIENNKDVEDSKDQELEKLREELARVTRDRDKMLVDRGLEEKWRKERETTIEELTNDSDYEEKEVDKGTRLKEINDKISSLAKEVETLINEYGSNNKNITKLEEKLQKALEKDNTTEVKELGEEISKIRDKNIELKNIINERKSAIESLQEEKELIQADTLALDALTPEEYQEITNTLRDKSIIRQILKQKGLYDIYKKKVEDRTPEEMDQIRNAIKNAATEISNAKLENREVSSLELVKALYGIESTVAKGTPANEVQMTSEELKEADKKAKTLIAESKEKEEENTSENDNKLYSGVYPMDSLPRVKSYNNGEPIYYTEAEQEEILKDRVLKIMYKDHPEYEKIDPNELEIVFDHQASDADKMGLDSETQLTRFTIERKQTKEAENTVEVEEELYSGTYPMDSLPRVKSYNNGEPIYYSEAEQEEILKNRVLEIMYNDYPEYREIDPNELEIEFDHQASDADMGLDSETQLTHFKIKRKTEKKKEDVTPEQTPEVTSDVTPEKTPEVTPVVTPEKTPEGTLETPSNLTPEPPSNLTPVGKSDPTPDKTSEKTPKKEPKAEPTKQEEPEEVANLYTVLGKLKEGIENKPKDFRRLQASKVTVAKDFVNDLRTKRVEYNVFGFIPAAGKALFRGISKYFAEIWSILDGGRVEGMMKKFQENWDKLTEEEKQILFDKYKGNEIQQLKLTGFNDALLPKLLEFGMAKIEKLNNNMKNNYAVLLETLKLIDELREKLAKGEVNKNEYNNAQETLLGQAARAIMYIMEDREKVNQILSSGVHGIQEDFKAVRSKMIYAGYRWAKEQELASDELLELGSYRGKLLDAIDKEKDPAIVVDNFMKMEGVLMDNTEIKKGILGERSVGKTYYMPIAEQFDYRGDPFIRNVIMTVTAVSSVVGMYNAYKTHKEIGQAEDRLREVDARNQAGAQNVRDTAQHQVDQSESIAKGMEAQGYTDTGGLAGLGERRGLDRTAHDGGGWDFSHYDDTDIHEWYNSVMERTTRTLAENQRRFNAGEMTSVQYLRANEDVLRELAETRHQFIADYMPQLQEYARNNNYDLDAFLTSFDYELAHPGAIGEGLDSISTVMDDAESLLNYTVENAAGKLPDDFLTTMLGLGSAQVLFGKLAKDQETMIKRGYGNETIDAMKERRRKELGEMEPETEEENENEEENEHSHRRR